MTSYSLQPGYTYDKSSSQIWQVLKNFGEALLEEKWMIKAELLESYTGRDNYQKYQEEIDALIEGMNKVGSGWTIKVRDEARADDSYLFMSASGGDSYRVAKEILARIVIELAVDCLHGHGMNLTVNCS